MTHGDKDKAKKTASKASGKSSGKTVEARKSGKEGGLKAGQSGKKGSGGSKKVATSEKGRPVKTAAKAAPPIKATTKAPAKADLGKGKPGPPAKSAAAPPKAEPSAGKGKPARGSAVDAGPPGFNNPVVANAFKRAVKKYPNAFRRLTD